MPTNFSPTTRLQKDIFRTLLYFDVFQHPLTPEEIYRFLPSNSTSVAEVTDACRTLPLSSLVANRDGFFSVADASPDLPRARLIKERRAKRYWRVACMMGGMIRHFPFVHGVFVSGELSKGVLAKEGDIDFFVVTADRRLWIARSFLILFKKVFLFNSKKFFCINHFISESYFEVTDRNRYIAVEIATLRSIFNEELLHRYRHANTWILDYLPNAGVGAPSPNASRSRSFFQRFLEAPFSGTWGDRLDSALLSFWRRIWNRRYAHVPEAKRNELFRSEPFLSTAYGGDFLNQILREYRKRLRQHGLDDHD